MSTLPATSEAIVDPHASLASVTRTVSDPVFHPPRPRLWLAGFALAFTVTMCLLGAIGWLFIRGVGIWGINMPIAWGFAIVNFVWWIGIGHAGTFISAILLLLHQTWRTSINRFT